MKFNINKAFCFDLDGTITNEEIIPLISKKTDLYEEINTITQITMMNMLDFKKSFKLRVKLLSDIPIRYVENISYNVKLNNKIVNFIKKHSDNSYIITGNLDVWIDKLIRNRICCKYYSSEAYYEKEKVLGIKNIISKPEIINKLKKDYDLVIAIGDGANDIEMFKEADISIAYGGVNELSESLINVSDYVVYSEDGLCKILNTL